jgi:Protein kinase domain
MQLGNRSDGAPPRGEFALVRVLGAPNSEVFQARSADGRDVVIRFWRPESELDARHAVEIANSARGVRSPMIASVFAIRGHTDGSLSLVSEYVAGRTLDSWLSVVGRPPLRMSVDFVKRLAQGLDAAHQRGLAHHALYPGNIIVAESGSKPNGRVLAKLVDLGVVRPRQGLRFEAAHFMSPEELVARLARGGRPTPIGPMMNVYSCGCVLHYLCTGQPPFQSVSLQGLAALHASGAVAVPSQLNPDIPEPLARVIAQCLERDLHRRIASPAALAAALTQLETTWRASGVRRTPEVRSPVPPPPSAAKRERTAVPEFDLVLRPRPMPPAPPTAVPPAAQQPRAQQPSATRPVRTQLPVAQPTAAKFETAPIITPSTHSNAPRRAHGRIPSMFGRALPGPVQAPRPTDVERGDPVASSIPLGSPSAVDFDPHERTTSVGVVVASTVVSRDSLSPYEVSRRESSVSAREDYVFRTLETRPRTRRWRWVAAAGAGVGAYVSLLALVHTPSEPHHSAAATPKQTSHAVEIVRVEGQAFPPVSDWHPALDQRPSPATTPTEVASSAPRKERKPEHDDSHSAARSSHSSSGTPNANRASLRRTEQLLDRMQVTREPIAQPRPPIADTAIVNIPSSPATAPAAPSAVSQRRVPAPSLQPVVIGKLWATPSVVEAPELRPKNGRPRNLSEPSAPRTTVDVPRSTMSQAHTENLEVRGSLSDQTVRRAIERIRPQLSDCFAQYGTGTNAERVARVELTIDETGRTRDARVHGTTPALEECLTQASRKLVAGAPDTGTVKVVWNLRYRR